MRRSYHVGGSKIHLNHYPLIVWVTYCSSQGSGDLRCIVSLLVYLKYGPNLGYTLNLEVGGRDLESTM